MLTILDTIKIIKVIINMEKITTYTFKYINKYIIYIYIYIYIYIVIVILFGGVLSSLPGT